MKKRLFSIVAIATLATNAWADISTEQLNTYMKASGADVVLGDMKKQISASIEMKAKMSGKEIPADDLNMMVDIVSNKENLALFTKGIQKLDEKDYKEIIKFYKTKIGKKSADLVRNMDMATMQKEMPAFAKKELSKERKSLITQLVEASMSEKKMEKMSKVMMKATISSLPKEMQAGFEEKMEAQMAQMKPMMREQAIISSAYIYKDYSDADLKSLIAHYKTPSAQKETDAMIDGGAEYMKVVMVQMMEAMKKKATATKH